MVVPVGGLPEFPLLNSTACPPFKTHTDTMQLQVSHWNFPTRHSSGRSCTRTFLPEDATTNIAGGNLPGKLKLKKLLEKAPGRMSQEKANLKKFLEKAKLQMLPGNLKLQMLSVKVKTAIAF